MDVPKSATCYLSGVLIDNLLPIARRIMSMPELEAGRSLLDSFFAGFVSSPMGRKENVKELLRRVFIRFKQTPG
jgi:hypothetical protein